MSHFIVNFGHNSDNQAIEFYNHNSLSQLCELIRSSLYGLFDRNKPMHHIIKFNIGNVYGKIWFVHKNDVHLLYYSDRRHRTYKDVTLRIKIILKFSINISFIHFPLFIIDVPTHRSLLIFFNNSLVFFQRCTRSGTILNFGAVVVLLVSCAAATPSAPKTRLLNSFWQKTKRCMWSYDQLDVPFPTAVGVEMAYIMNARLFHLVARTEVFHNSVSATQWEVCPTRVWPNTNLTTSCLRWSLSILWWARRRSSWFDYDKRNQPSICSFFSFWTNTNKHKHTQTHTNIHKHIQTYTNIYKHTQTYTNIHKKVKRW